jgi:hypothetical protein
MRFTLLLAFSLALSGCKVQFNSDSSEQGAAREGSASEQAAVRAAATAYLSQIDMEQWDGVWSSAAPCMKQMIAQPEFISGVHASRAIFGVPIKPRVAASYAFPESIEGMPPGQYGVVFYSTDFSKIGEVEEQVVLCKKSDGWRLAGYWVEKHKQVKLRTKGNGGN